MRHFDDTLRLKAIFKISTIWNAKLTESQIFSELSIEIELSNWIKELSNWIKELFNSIRELFNSIRELFNSIRELFNSIRELSIYV